MVGMVINFNSRDLYTHYKDSLGFRWDEFIP